MRSDGEKGGEVKLNDLSGELPLRNKAMGNCDGQLRESETNLHQSKEKKLFRLNNNKLNEHYQFN